MQYDHQENKMFQEAHSGPAFENIRPMPYVCTRKFFTLKVHCPLSTLLSIPPGQPTLLVCNPALPANHPACHPTLQLLPCLQISPACPPSCPKALPTHATTRAVLILLNRLFV